MTPFDWQFPYPSQRMPVLAHNVVSTSQPLAAQAGLSMMQKGGNAVDAIVATAITLTVLEPTSNGIGGDAFCILWDGQKMHGLNASGRSPVGWNRARFKGLNAMPSRGWESVTVPGCVSAWAALSKKFGALPFDDLFEPAIKYARDGFLVSPTIAGQWASQVPELKSQPGFAESFMPGGQAPYAGEKFRFVEQAETLAKIADSQGEAFYHGELAEKIAISAKHHGAALTLEDMAAHSNEWVEPMGLDYRGFTLHELPPNGQGIAALVALGILENFDMAALAVDSVESHHLQIEAMKLAFADIYEYVADPATMRVKPSEMIDKAYLKQRASLIDRNKASCPLFGKPDSSGTVYLTAADEAGMMVSYIQSNYSGFGSGVVVPGTGISLQNRGAGFSLNPRHTNVVAAGKRPFHTIIPGFLSQAGKPLMSFGVMGAAMQAQGHTQVVSRLVDYHLNPQAIADAPRWRVYEGRNVSIEYGASAQLLDGLRTLGHVITPAARDSSEFGRAQLIHRLDEGYLAASERRSDGQAVGF